MEGEIVEDAASNGEAATGRPFQIVMPLPGITPAKDEKRQRADEQRFKAACLAFGVFSSVEEATAFETDAEIEIGPGGLDEFFPPGSEAVVWFLPRQPDIGIKVDEWSFFFGEQADDVMSGDFVKVEWRRGTATKDEEHEESAPDEKKPTVAGSLKARADAAKARATAEPEPEPEPAPVRRGPGRPKATEAAEPAPATKNAALARLQSLNGKK